MNVQETLVKAADAMNAKTVFGDAIQHDGVLVIPAAKIRGGAGGGTALGPGGTEKGTGTGFGITALPAGAFVFRNGKLRWKPAIDVNRIVLGGQLLLLVALFTVGRTVARALCRTD
jgi:uncharacterized spore protein YtfJ